MCENGVVVGGVVGFFVEGLVDHGQVILVQSVEVGDAGVEFGE